MTISLTCFLLTKVTGVRVKLTNHSRQKAGSKLLAAIFYDGLARAVIQGYMTTLAPFGIDTHKNTTLGAEFKNPFYKIPAFHDLKIGHLCPNFNGIVTASPDVQARSRNTIPYSTKRPRRNFPDGVLSSSSDRRMRRPNIGAPTGNRTPNLLIKSQLLYQLSYGRN